MPTWTKVNDGYENPLPFDEITPSYLPTYRPLSLVERLEAYEPKGRLMLYELLDSAGINASAVRDAIKERYKWGTEWQNWKNSIIYTTGKSWPECAQLIYGSFFDE